MTNTTFPTELFIGTGIVLLIASLGWALREYYFAKKLKKLGTTADARVVELEKSSWSRNLRYYVIYQFNVNDDLLERRQAIGWRHRNKIHLGSTITVSYLPNNPTCSRLSGSDTDNTSRDDALLTALVVLLTLVAFLREHW